MTELLAVLTAIFVVYAMYEVFATVSQSGDGLRQTSTDRTPNPQPTLARPTAVLAAAAPAPVSAAETKPTAAVPVAEKHLNLRNPVTGEVSPAPSNYRFAKKWIKEALVSEGLLSKVYKNSELTEALNAQAKTAIETFKQLEKYHV